MAGDSQSHQNPINDEAAQWVVVLSESAPSQQERRAFEAWRAQGPAYFLAYEFALRAWNRAEMLSALRPASAAADADLLVRYTLQSKAPRRWVIAGVGILLAACLTEIVVTWFGYHSAATYETALGERCAITLADGNKNDVEGFVSSVCQVFGLKAVVSDRNTFLSKIKAAASEQ